MNFPGSSGNAGYYVWYEPLLWYLIDEITARSRAGAVRVHDPYFPHSFVFVDDSNCAQRIANLSNNPIVATVVDPVPFDNLMTDVPISISAVKSVALELSSVHAYLERAGVPSEGVNIMVEAVAKLSSVVSSHFAGSKDSISADVLEPPTTE